MIDSTRQSLFGKTVSKDAMRCVSLCVCVDIDPHKGNKIEAESLKEGILSAVKFTKVNDGLPGLPIHVWDVSVVYILCVSISHRKG